MNADYCLQKVLEYSLTLNNCCAFVKECVYSGVCHFGREFAPECEEREVFQTIKEALDGDAGGKTMIINNNGVIRAVIDRNGHKMQTVIAIEEMSELTKELTKSIRGEDRHEEILEETADVMICIRQIQEMYNLKDEELQNMINRKLDRLRERLEEK